MVTDTNGCESLPTAIGIICPPGTPPTPTPNPNDSNLPQPCIGLINCPLNTNTFLLGISASTLDVNFDPSDPSYQYTFNFKLSSPSSYTGSVVGSYKMYEVDLPNSFLIRNSLGVISLGNQTKYWNGANGSPNVKLNDYVEFGFTELTPTTPTNDDSPWNIRYYPFGEQVSYYTSPYSWIPGTTTIQIAVALFDDEYCVHKGTTTIIIPLDNITNTASISF